MQVVIDTTPRELSELLSLTVPAAGSYVIWQGIIENLGPQNVFWRRKTTAPDLTIDAGRRLASRGKVKISEYSNWSDGPVWLWTERATALVIFDAVAHD